MRTRERKRSRTWAVLASSVRGAAHCRRGEPNQDAVEWLPMANSGPPLIVAVSDGHGSSRSFRSDRGARIAVNVAVTEAEKLLKALPDTEEAIREAVEKGLPATIVQAWEQRILEDIATESFTPKERK